MENTDWELVPRTSWINFSFPKFLPTGVYTIRALGHEDSVLGKRLVLLEEIRPDRIRVRAKILEKRLRGGQKVHLRVSAMHFFWKPVVGKAVQAHLEIFPARFRPKGFERYRFFSTEAENNENRLSFLFGTKKLNEKGEAVFEIGLPDSPLCRELYTAVFSCSVIEEGGRAVTCKISKPLHLYKAYLGICCESTEPSLGRDVTFSVVALGPQGEPATIPEAVLRLSRVYFFVSYEADGKGNWRRVSKTEEKEILCGSVPLKEGRGTFTFKPNAVGRYILRIQAGGTRHTASLEFYVHGPNWPLRSFAHPMDVSVSLDKEFYKPGEQAEVLVVTPFAGNMLLSVESDRIHHLVTQRVEAGSNRIAIPVREEYWPNAYVSCVVLKPYFSRPQGLSFASCGKREIRPIKAAGKAHAEAQVAKGEKLSPSDLLQSGPLIGYGIAVLRIDPETKKIQIKLDLPGKARPGEELKVKIKTLGPEREPIPCEFVCALVDEGLLSLTSERAPDPLGFFGAPRRPAFSLAKAFSFLVPPKCLLPGGGKETQTHLEVRLNPVQYETPKPVAFFFAPSRTNSQGEAQIKIEVPEFSGTLRVVTVAAHSRVVGSARGDVVVVPRISVRDNFPRFLSPGDRAPVPIVFFNNEREPADLKIRLQCDGPLSLRFPAKVEVHPERKAVCEVELVAGERHGLAEITLKVEGEEFDSTKEIQLPIRPAWGREALSRSGLIKKGTSKKLIQEESLPDFFPSTYEARVFLAPNVFAQFAPLAEHLVRYPYGCAEQTTSCLLASAACQKLGTEEEKEASAAIARGIERLASMQTPSGGIGMWVGSCDAVPWVSAFAAHILYTVREGNEILIGEILQDLLN